MSHSKAAAALAWTAAMALVASACLSTGTPKPRRLRASHAEAHRRLFDLEPPSNKEGYYQWMWGDVEELGDHGLAEQDPFRWSDWLNAAGTIADLEAYKTPQNKLRPVELATGTDAADDFIRPLKFGSIDEAIAYLSQQTTTQAPKVVEKVHNIPVGGDCPDSAHLRSNEAIACMAIGSAITVAVFLLYQLCSCTCRRVFRGVKRSEKETLLYGSDSDDDLNKDRSTPLAITEGRQPQPYQGLGTLKESELRALLADIEEEERLMLTGPRSFSPGAFGSADGTATLRKEATQEVERVLNSKSARDIFGSGSASDQRAKYRRLVRLFHPDKKILEGERASLALRRVVEAYRSLASAS